MKTNSGCHNSSYTKGAFLNVFRYEPHVWEADLQRLLNLHSLSHVEVWLEYTPVAEECAVLRDMLSSTTVLVHGPFIQTSFATNWEELAEISTMRLSRAFECASTIRAKVVTFHAGTYPFFVSREAAFERLAHRFSTFAATRRPTAALENMPARDGTVRECLARLDDLRLLKDYLPEARFTLDIGHCLQNGDNFINFLPEFGSCIENIHLHDGRVGGRSHLPLGAGELNLVSFLDALKSVRFSRHVSLETITPEDTAMSWAVWAQAEKHASRESRDDCDETRAQHSGSL